MSQEMHMNRRISPHGNSCVCVLDLRLYSFYSGLFEPLRKTLSHPMKTLAMGDSVLQGDDFTGKQHWKSLLAPLLPRDKSVSACMFTPATGDTVTPCLQGTQMDQRT